jgi:hypothetical protein
MESLGILGLRTLHFTSHLWSRQKEKQNNTISWSPGEDEEEKVGYGESADPGTQNTSLDFPLMESAEKNINRLLLHGDWELWELEIIIVSGRYAEWEKISRVLKNYPSHHSYGVRQKVSS